MVRTQNTHQVFFAAQEQSPSSSTLQVKPMEVAFLMFQIINFEFHIYVHGNEMHEGLRMEESIFEPSPVRPQSFRFKAV